jgi:hypothetical protein
VGDATHAFKGAVGAFGTTPAFEKALQLETAARTGKLSACAQLYGQLQEEVRRLQPALEQLASRDGASRRDT